MRTRREKVKRQGLDARSIPLKIRCRTFSHCWALSKARSAGANGRAGAAGGARSTRSSASCCARVDESAADGDFRGPALDRRARRRRSSICSPTTIGTAKILLLVNYRPEYSHQWGPKTYYTQLRLDPLGHRDRPTRCSRRCSAIARAGSAKKLIIEKTEGNPFFMEETVQVLFDENALVRDGGGEAHPVDWRVEDSADRSGDSRRAHRPPAAGCQRPVTDAGGNWPRISAVADSRGGLESRMTRPGGC